MSFQNYDSFQQQGQPDAGGPGGPGGPQQQDTTMGGQAPDAGQQQFQAGQMDPGSAGGQPGSESKTTLWYVPEITPFTLS